MKMTLYYVTNRKHNGDDQFKPEGYGIQPSESGIENLRLGKVTMDPGVNSFNKWFTAGTGSGKGNGVLLTQDLIDRVEDHAKIVAYEESIPDPKRAENKQDGTRLGSQQMFKDIQDTMRQGRDVLLYVHGFNVSWKEAVSSALALQTMLNRPGVRPKDKGEVLVILFTWPSDGSALPFVAYKSDRTEAIGSGFALGRGLLKFRDFLADVTRGVQLTEDASTEAADPCNQNINLLCHSMGNYVLQNAIHRMIERSESGRLPRIFDHVFMCAPDVDDDVLEAGNQLGRLHEVCRNVNVYFNRGDLALRGSDYTKGNPDRLGTNGAANPLQVHQKIYQIDCSGDVVEGVLEHSYYLKGGINADIRMSLDNIPQDARKHRRKHNRFSNTFVMKSSG